MWWVDILWVISVILDKLMVIYVGSEGNDKIIFIKDFKEEVSNKLFLYKVRYSWIYFGFFLNCF